MILTVMNWSKITWNFCITQSDYLFKTSKCKTKKIQKLDIIASSNCFFSVLTLPMDSWLKNMVQERRESRKHWLTLDRLHWEWPEVGRVLERVQRGQPKQRFWKTCETRGRLSWPEVWMQERLWCLRSVK